MLKRFGYANAVSLFRMGLALFVLAMLFVPSAVWYAWAFGLTVAVIWLDGVDGYLARKFGESSKLGALVDILSDRAVEQVYWISFAVLGWVPLWVPLTVVMRGIWVDGLRSLALERGYTAFGQASMMRSPLGVLLVSSRFSRWSYAAFKAVAFGLLIVAHLPEWPGWLLPYRGAIVATADFSVYATVFFCLVRGLPVLLEARRFVGDR